VTLPLASSATLSKEHKPFSRLCSTRGERSDYSVWTKKPAQGVVFLLPGRGRIVIAWAVAFLSVQGHVAAGMEEGGCAGNLWRRALTPLHF
jgi:hypothetical protein